MSSLSKNPVSDHLPSWRIFAQKLFLVIVWLALVVWFYIPMKEVMSTSLDSSNYASYAYFTAHHFQYGPQVVPMSGPYGFVLYGTTYSGELFYLHTFGQLAVMGVLSALTLWFFNDHRGSVWRWIWLLAHILFTPFFDDLPIEWTILLGGFFLLCNGYGAFKSIAVAGVCAAIAFLSLIKGTHLILALATISVVALAFIASRQWRRLAFIIGSYICGLLIFWFLAGQHLANIPQYISGVFELANGYNQAMSLDEKSAVLIRGLVIASLLGLGFIWGLGSHYKNPFIVASVLLLAGHSFVQWKHGFVRADGHTGIFFYYAAVASITLVLIARRIHCPRLNWHTLTGSALASLVLVAGAAGPNDIFLPQPIRILRQIPNQFITHAQELLSLPSRHASLKTQLQGQRELHSLPLVREKVGQQTIDLFGYEHGLIPLNGLNYHPRPMGGGSFNAYTPALMQMNRDFIRWVATRPDFYLLKIQTIDDRFVTQDDALALLELLRNYRPIFTESDHVLLRALPPAPLINSVLISQHTAKFGDVIDVPLVGPDELLLARLDIRLNFLGKLLNFVYKVPQVLVSLRGANIENAERRRLIPSMTQVPFLLNPVLENTEDFLRLFTDQEGKAARQIRISTRDRTWFVKEFAIEFYRRPRPNPLPQIRIESLMGAIRAVAADVTTQNSERKSTTVRVQSLNAPGELSWVLDGTERTFSFSYGFFPGSWEPANHTDGALFITQLRRGNASPIQISLVGLFPASLPADRSYHTLELPLPSPRPGDRLALVTNPGENGNTAWDWTYVGHLQFNRGNLTPDQFPNFNLAPTNMDADLASVETIDGRDVLLLPAPGEISFLLKGNEHSIRFDFGLNPVNYSGNGLREGSGYSVELARAGHKSEVLYQRFLNPVTDPSDRELQQATLSLPTLAAGDRLIIRTHLGPQALVPWGWPYILNLKLQ